MAMQQRNKILIALGTFLLSGVLITGVACTNISAAFQPATPTPSPLPTQTPPPQVQESPTRGRPNVANVTPSVTITTSDAIPAVRLSSNRIRATGNTISANQATLAFQVAGRIKEIKVKEGERVKAGVVIATLDTTGLDATVLQAQANLDSALSNLAKVKTGPNVDEVTIAKATLDRAKAAVDVAQAAYDRIGGASNPASGISSQALTLQQATSTFQEALARYNIAVNHPTPQELAAAQATAAVAQAALETAKVAANNARLIAPFDGTVVSILAKVGESAIVGTAAATIADLSRMQVVANIDEISVSSIQPGQAATISIDAIPGKLFKGRVSKIGLLASATGNLVTMPVTIDLESSDSAIYPGLSATIEISANPS